MSVPIFRMGRPPRPAQPAVAAAHTAAAAGPGWHPPPAPALAATHQGLWLEAAEDVLLGRSESGAVWLWDLTTALGWSRGQGTWARVAGDLPASHWPAVSVATRCTSAV
jgi:hypothetical protein